MTKKRSRHTNTETCELCSEKLQHAHPLLQQFARGIREMDKEAHVSWSVRGKKDQEDALLRGTSKARFGDSPHNYTPSLALDFFRLTPNGIAEWQRGWFRDKIVAPATKAGLEPGSTWGDWPHVQLRNWKRFKEVLYEEGKATPPTRQTKV